MAPHSRPGNTEPHVVDRLVEYLSGSLTPDNDVVVESHLLACAACRAEYEELGPVALMMARQSDDALIDATLGERPPAPRSPVAPPPPQTTGDSNGIFTDRLSISLVAVDGGTEVRADAVGLRSGREFQLIAVSVQGRGHVVATGVADGRPQSIVGTVPVAASEIVFAALVEDAGAALLIARPT